MLQNLFLILILVFFILAFAIRNLKTFLSTRQSIKGKSGKLTISILLSALIYLLLLLRLTVLPYNWVLEANLSRYPIISFVGYAFVLAGFVLGLLALIAMRNSWRVGIRYDQKTDLVISGIYRFSRNPYFLSYNVLIFGYLLIFPSPILAILLISLAITFHRMILEEEAYLESVHGDEYLKYKKRVNRYLTLG